MSGAETLLAFATIWIAALMLPTSVRGRGMVLLLLTGISVLLSVGWSLGSVGGLFHSFSPLPPLSFRDCPNHRARNDR